MKKTYLQPKTKVHSLNTIGMLAGSITSVSGGSGLTMGSSSDMPTEADAKASFWGDDEEAW